MHSQQSFLVVCLVALASSVWAQEYAPPENASPANGAPWIGPPLYGPTVGPSASAPSAMSEYLTAPSVAAAGPAPAASPAPAATAEVAEPPKIWEGSIELGLNGSEGNSQTLNLRGGAKLKRKTEINVFSAEIDYRKDSADSVETANKAYLDWRYEHLLGKSPWTWFLHGTLDHDEFQAFDLRVAVDSGLGYRFIKNDSTLLTGRVGGGTSREFGGPDDAWVPEGVLGLELEHRLSKRHKLVASAEYRPDVSDFTDYRLINKASWEILLDEAMHLSAKLGVTERYDSTPQGRKPNDLDYSIVLLWSF